jgi:hypothetical protein
LQIAVADKSTSQFCVNNIALDRASNLEVRFKYRSTSPISANDRGSWVLIVFFKPGGVSIGTSAVICTNTTQWKGIAKTIPVPEGAVQCSLAFRMQEQNGRFDIADISVGEPDNVSVLTDKTEERQYAKAYRVRANLTYKKTNGVHTLTSPTLTLKAVEQAAPYGFVLPDDLCDNPDLVYEVECAFRPKWSSHNASDISMIFALGQNISGSDQNSLNLTFLGGNCILSRLRAAEGGVVTEIHAPVAINAGQRCTIKTRWSESEETLWVNGQEITCAVMPKKFVWGKNRKFYIFGENIGRGLLNADVEQFSLRVYEPRVKAVFAGSPRDRGYFTGAGPFRQALSFPLHNGTSFASTLAVFDIEGKKIAVVSPDSITAEAHSYRLPPLPFGWYKLQATIIGEGAEKELAMPICITAGPALREPAEYSLYGITEEWPFGRDTFDAATVDALMYRMSQMGIRWFRAWCAWDYIEETPGVYYWEKMDRFLAIADKYGITVYPVIMGGGKPFMNPRTLTHKFDVSIGFRLPPDRTLWDNYVKAFATRYKGKFPYYQMWNEADTRQFLYPFKTEAYAAWLKETAAIIRAADPAAKLCLGGFCAAYNDSLINGTSHTDRDAAYGLAEWYAQKPQADYDVVDYHLYSAGGPLQSWDGTVQLMERLRPYMAAHGDGGKPVWNSETSFQSADNPKLAGVPGGLFNVPLLTEREQACRVVQWHVQSKALDIKHNFNYAVRGSSGPINSDFSPKPAYVAHQNLASTLAGLKYERTLRLNNNIRAYQFVGAKRCVTVLWTMGGSEILAAKNAASDTSLTRIDLFGNRSPGESTLILTEEPMYFESQQPPVLQELVSLQLPGVVLAGVPYDARLTIHNLFAGELRCAIDARAAGKSELRKSFNVPSGKEITEPIRISGAGTPLTVEGTLSGAVAHDFYLELPVPLKKAVLVSSTTPGRFEITEASQVCIGGPVIDTQNRVVSEGVWKGKNHLSAVGTVTVRDRAATVVVAVKDDAFFPDQTGNALWNGDAVELFLDLRSDTQKAAHAMNELVKLVVAGNGKYLIGRNQTLDDLVVSAKRTADGYAVTVAFTLPAHITRNFGFDAAIDSADTATSGRTVRMMWAGTAGNHTNPDSYGAVILSPETPSPSPKRR